MGQAGLPAPLPLLMRGMSSRRISRSTLARGFSAVAALHGGRARAHHADALVGQHGVVHHVGRVRAQRARGSCARRRAGRPAVSRPVASTTRRASTAWRPAGIRYRAGPGRRRAAARPARDVRCARPGPARGGTSAGSPSIAGVGSCPARPRLPVRTGPLNQAQKVSAGGPARGRSAAWAQRFHARVVARAFSLRATGRRWARSRPGASARTRPDGPCRRR